MKTEHFVDKSKWKDGPWKKEPDKAHWVDEKTGLDCLIVRGPHGALCGYVGVKPGHIAYEKGYDEVQSSYDHESNEDKSPLINIEVHYGLTYSAACQEDGHICHKVEGEDKVWWLGFDCAHSGDICPSHLHYETRFMGREYESYKDFNFVKAECESLARQLARGA